MGPWLRFHTPGWGGYRILETIGRGGMGEVHLAESRAGRKRGPRVALKVLGAVPRQRPEARARFRREATALRRCDHPNIPSLVQDHSDEVVPWMVMEWVQGVDLELLLRHLAGAKNLQQAIARAHRAGPGRPPVRSSGKPAHGVVPQHPVLMRQLVRLMRDTAQALEHLHARGLVHRDLKPSNLVVSEDARCVKLIDFGLCRLNGSSSLTRESGCLLGTLRYMAPEQTMPTSCRVDERADLYGLGATFWEAFTGSRLFDASSAGEMLRATREELPQRARLINPVVTPELDLLLAQLLAKEPEDRPETARAVVTRIDRWLRS